MFIYIYLFSTIIVLLSKNKNCSQLYVYLLLISFWEDLQNTTYNISLYYKIVSLLNNKVNLTILLILTLLLYNNKQNKTMILKNIVAVIWITLNLNFENIYINLFFLENTITPLNVNLLNGLMLIHPIILYTFYVFYILVFKVNLLNKYKKVFKKKKSNTKNILLLVSIYLSIILGCWWAEQELSWGGWWSWDFVELIALNFFLMVLLKIHTTKTQNAKLDTDCFYVFCIIVVAVLFVRFNIINSIHNFINIESQNQYFYYIVYTIIFILLYLILNILKPTICFNNYKLGILNPYLLIRVLILLFYLLSLLNLFLVDFFNFKYSIQLNLKSIYIYILYVYVLIIFLKLNIFKNYFLLFILYYIFWFSFIDCLFLMVCLNIINYYAKHLQFTHILHLFLVFFYLIVLHQIYNFTKCDFYLKFFKILSMKVTTFNQLQCLTYSNDCYIHNYLNNYSKVLLNNRCVTGKIIDPLFKNIFEKNIYIISNKLEELYNYNLQLLTEISNVGLFVFLFLFLIILLSFWCRYIFIYL